MTERERITRVLRALGKGPLYKTHMRDKTRMYQLPDYWNQLLAKPFLSGRCSVSLCNTPVVSVHTPWAKTPEEITCGLCKKALLGKYKIGLYAPGTSLR